MSMNARSIEIFSVNAIKDSIASSDFLEPFIADNDKEPSWDGAVYIYENKNHSKDYLKGRMPVQVKGKEWNDFSQEEISYSMSTIDLRNYLYDGGVILFVVYIGSVGLTRKIYYIELPPIKLRFILADANDQKTKALNLKAFPNEGDRKATIFMNCLLNCQKQASFTDAKLLSLEELEKQGVLEGITVPISAVGINDPQRALVTNEVYVYAKIKGCAIPQPLEFIPQHLVTNQEQSSIISIEDNVYYTKIEVIKSANSTIFKLGDSFTIRYIDEYTPCKIDYKNSSKIRTLARDLDFMISFIENEYFNIGSVKFPFERARADFTNFNIEEQKQLLVTTKRTVEALDILNCSEDVDMCDLSITDHRNLEVLITAFVDKQPVMNIKPDLPEIIKIRVGTLSFAICKQPCAGIENAFNIYDFFKTEMSLAYDIDGEKLPISQYAILSANDLLTVNNVRFDILLPSFQKVEKHYDTYNRANWFLLELIKAYDMSGGARVEILKTAYEFAEWVLHEANEEELPYHVRILNYLQVIKRKRDFECNEMDELYSLVGSGTAREDILVGAYLLLSQQKSAEFHFKKLSPTMQDDFRTYPIYHFWTNPEIKV